MHYRVRHHVPTPVFSTSTLSCSQAELLATRSVGFNRKPLRSPPETSTSKEVHLVPFGTLEREDPIRGRPVVTNLKTLSIGPY